MIALKIFNIVTGFSFLIYYTVIKYNVWNNARKEKKFWEIEHNKFSVKDYHIQQFMAGEKLTSVDPNLLMNRGQPHKLKTKNYKWGSPWEPEYNPSTPDAHLQTGSYWNPIEKGNTSLVDAINHHLDKYDMAFNLSEQDVATITIHNGIISTVNIEEPKEMIYVTQNPNAEPLFFDAKDVLKMYNEKIKNQIN